MDAILLTIGVSFGITGFYLGIIAHLRLDEIERKNKGNDAEQ